MGDYKDDLKKIEQNARTRLNVAERELAEKLDVSIAASERKLGLGQSYTSTHAHKVSKARDPEQAKSDAREMIDRSAKLANEYLTEEEMLRRIGTDPDKHSKLIDKAFEEPLKPVELQKMKPLSEAAGAFTRRELIKGVAADLEDPSRGRSRGI